MTDRNFRELLEARWAEGKFVCVGLDSEQSKIPPNAHRTGGIRCGLSETARYTFVEFNERIVDATKDLVCAYKPNAAFYEAYGDAGLIALRETIAHIRKVAPDVPVIFDAKRADIGNTNEEYAKAAFNYLDADAITVHPYLGQEALKPFLDRKDKGIIVLCRTSNPGAGEFQDLTIPLGKESPNLRAIERHLGREIPSGGMPLYQYVAYRIATEWNKNGNCALVVGATYPDELRAVREIVGDLPILIPGIGAQGGDLEKTVAAGKDARGRGMIINSSRGIIFASKGADFAEAARRETQKLHDAITACLQKGGET